MNEYQKIINSIDQKGYYSNYISNISKQFEKVINSGLLDDNLLIQKCKWEIDFFNFDIADAEIIPMFSSPDKSGNIYEYPNFNDIGDDGLIYLISRSEETKSNQIKAHYNHLLWLSPKKNRIFATSSIDSYFEILQVNEKEKFQSWFETVKTIKNLFIVATESNQRITDVKNWIIGIIKQLDLNVQESCFILRNLSSFMIDKKKTFKAADFEANIIKLEQLCDLSLKGKDSYETLDSLKLLINIKKKRQEDCKSNKKQLAETYEQLANEKNSNDLISYEYYQKSLLIYKEIKEDNKIVEIEKAITEMKKKSNGFSNISTEINMETVIKYSKELASKLIALQPNEIIQYLINSVEIIPQIEKIEEEVKIQKTSFFDIVPASLFDRNGNVSQSFKTNEEIKYYKFLKTYDYDFKLLKNFIIQELIKEIIKNNSFTLVDLIIYLKEKSWFGKNLTKYAFGERFEYNWLNTLLPSINEYFNQIKINLIQRNIYPDLVLCTDSLTLKFEGLFRDLCELNKITTFFITKDEHGEEISREKDINALLREPKLKELLIPSDLFFFKYLLVEKGGYNLRNKVAHSFLNYNDYTIEEMNLLFVAILRLAKYDFVFDKK